MQLAMGTTALTPARSLEPWHAIVLTQCGPHLGYIPMPPALSVAGYLIVAGEEYSRGQIKWADLRRLYDLISRSSKGRTPDC